MSDYNAVMCINWVQTPLSQLNIQCIHSLKCGEKNRSLTRVVGCNLQGKVNYLLKGQEPQIRQQFIMLALQRNDL